MTKQSSGIRKSEEPRNKKLTFGPKVEDSREIRYRNTFDPTVLDQPVGDVLADLDGKAAARDELFDDVARAEGLR